MFDRVRRGALHAHQYTSSASWSECKSRDGAKSGEVGLAGGAKGEGEGCPETGAEREGMSRKMEPPPED